jgi:hypothetical protein
MKRIAKLTPATILEKRRDHALILSLFKSIHEDLPVFKRRELVDGHLHIDGLTQLCASACGCRVNRLNFSVIRGNSEGDGCEEQSNEQ